MDNDQRNSKTKKSQICIISYSRIAQDSRVLRQIEFLSRKYALTIIGYGPPHQIYSSKEDITWVSILRKARSIKRIIKDLWRIFRYFIGLVDRPSVLRTAIEAKADVYHANNWDTLPIAAKAARINKAELVIDIHESLRTASGWLYTLLNKVVVRRYKNQIDYCTTVVNPISEDYDRVFNLQPIVIRNIPKLPDKQISFIRTNRNNIQLIHHGIASPERSSALLINTLAKCEMRYELHLVFLNYDAPYTKYLIELANQISPGRVFFYPPFPSLEIIERISSFDIGFYPLPPINYNNKIALPNKLFEFIAAGLAVCIGPSPSMAEIVQKYNCGIIAPSFRPEDLAGVINRTSSDEWDTMKKASLSAKKELNAEIEMQKLMNIYSILLS